MSIGLVSVAAVAFGEPLVFPSLGPTAFLLSYSPTDAATTPRNIIFGHFLGVVSGYVALLTFGLAGDPSAFAAGFTFARAGAAALSLGLTGALMTWVDACVVGDGLDRLTGHTPTTPRRARRGGPTEVRDQDVVSVVADLCVSSDVRRFKLRLRLNRNGEADGVSLASPVVRSVRPMGWSG